MGSDTFLLPALETHARPRVSANPLALRTLDLDPGNPGTEFRAAPPRVRSAGYGRSLRDRAYIQPASPRRSGQKARAPGRARARSLPRDLRSGPMRER